MATQEALDALIAHHFQKHGFEKSLESFRRECKFKDQKKVDEDLEAVYNLYLSSKELRLKQENHQDSHEANGKSKKKEKKSKQVKSNTESVDGKHAVEDENVAELTKKRKAASEDRNEADAREAENGTPKKKKKGKKDKLQDDNIVGQPVSNGTLEGSGTKEPLSGTPAENVVAEPNGTKSKKKKGKPEVVEPKGRDENEERIAELPSNAEAEKVEAVGVEEGQGRSHKKKKGKKDKVADVDTKTAEEAKGSEENMANNVDTEKAQGERPPSESRKKKKTKETPAEEAGNLQEDELPEADKTQNESESRKKKKAKKTAPEDLEMKGNEEKKQDSLDNAGAEKVQNGHTGSESRKEKKGKKANVEAETEEGDGNKKKKDKKLKAENEQKNESGEAENLSVKTKKRKGKKVEAEEKTENLRVDGGVEGTAEKEKAKNVKAEAPEAAPNEDVEDEKDGNGQNKEERTPAKEQELSDRKKKRDVDSAGKEKSAGKAFQRVKPEEVEFLDSRLKDNSYWAKDGADNGWGAKAQEVLGQVKGRGFRHEKTKKKRGSYKGGAIDVQPHSIKFNNDSDDEE